MSEDNGAKPVRMPAVLSAADVASYLHLNYGTVIRLLHAGRLPGRKVGGMWRIRRHELDAMLLPDTWQARDVAKNAPLYDLQQTT